MRFECRCELSLWVKFSESVQFKESKSKIHNPKSNFIIHLALSLSLFCIVFYEEEEKKIAHAH